MIPKNIRAVLFDFDGTLADSYGAIAASVNHVREQHGLPPMPTNEVRKYVGHGPDFLLQHTIPGSQDIEKDFGEYRKHHPSVMYTKTFLLPGASELLAALSRNNREIGLCSNKPVQFSRELLKHLQIDNLFTVLLGPELVANPKPAPDMLLKALELLDMSVDEVLYVGDMSVDIQTARSAGLPVFVVPTGSESVEVLESHKPDRLLKDLFELIDLLGLN